MGELESGPEDEVDMPMLRSQPDASTAPRSLDQSEAESPRRATPEKTTYLAGRAVEDTGRPKAVHEQLFVRISERVYGYFRLRAWNPQDAQELAQETLLVLYSSLDRYDPSYSFNGWLFRKAHDVWVDWNRRRGRRLTPGPLPPADPPAPSPESDEVAARLDAEFALSTLRERVKPKVYEAFLLFYSELSAREVARQLGVPKTTATRWIRQAESQLERILRTPGDARRG